MPTSKNENKVSAILPVYNTSKYLKQCLDSVLSQTYANLEVICINDGSTDNSLAILQDYSAKDSRIKIVDQKNAGLSAARDAGFTVATGEYVIFIDSDDYVEPDMVKSMLDCAKENKSDIVVCNANEYLEQYNFHFSCTWVLEKKFRPQKNNFSYSDYKDTIFQISSPNVWTKLFRRDFLIDNKLIFGAYRYIEDVPFSYYAMVLASKISIIDKVFYHYRINRGEALTAKPRSEYSDYIQPYLDLKNKLAEIGVYDDVKRSFANRFFRSLVWEYSKIGNREIFDKSFLYIKQEVLPALELDNCGEEYFYEKDTYSLYRALLDGAASNSVLDSAFGRFGRKRFPLAYKVIKRLLRVFKRNSNPQAR